MDLITRNLKRTVSSTPAASVNYFTTTTAKDNISNTSIFINQRSSQLTVSPFTSTNEMKLADTSDFSTYTETPTLFGISGWGAGSNEHSQFALWYKNEYPTTFTNHVFATNDNNSIIVVYDFASTKIKVSTDSGLTWVDSTTTFPGYSGGNLFYSEQKFFMIYYNGQGAWSSTDGMTWVTSGTSNYASSWSYRYGTPNFTFVYNANWNGSSYSLNSYTIKNNVITNGPSISSSNYIAAFANKTSGYNTTSFALAVMGENVYQITWNGTAASFTDLGFLMFGRYVPSMFYDETNSRWLALVLPQSVWNTGNIIQQSLDDGVTWTEVTTIPDQYANKSTIFVDLLGRIVISGNSIGVAIYDENSDTWLAGDDQERVISIRQLNSSTHIMTSVNWKVSYDNKVSIVNMPTLAEGPLFTNRKWHGYTNGTASIIQHFSSDGYNTFANVTPTFLNAGYNPYIPSGNTGPSYITKTGGTVTTRVTAGVNYDKIHYLMTTDNTDSTNYQTRPMASVNVWRSTDGGNTYNITSNFAYTPTYYDTNVTNFSSNTNLPGWTDATAPTNSEICYSRVIAEPSYSAAGNINNRTASVTPASINDMIYQDNAFWAWGHNGLLMTSPNEGTSFFDPSWKRFPALQDLCLGSRITAFCKEGSKLFVFTNLGQFIVSLDLGITWTDRTSAVRSANMNPASAAYSIPMTNIPLGCIYTNGKLIAICYGGIFESTNDGVSWTKNAYNSSTNGFPICITKHPTSDVILIGTMSGILRVTASDLTTFVGITLHSGLPMSKIVWAGTRWYVFYDNNTTNYGRYSYSDGVMPTSAANWVTPVAAGGTTALPSAQYIGSGSNVVTTNAYWDGTRMIVTDYINNQVYMSDGVTNSWQNISNGIRAYSDSVFKTKLKHVWTVASNGTTLVAAGDMCDAVASTPANALSATKWTVTQMKNNSGVIDPVITYETEIYVANVSVTSAGTGYSVANISTFLTGLTLNSATPSKPNGGVKPIFSSAATNGTTGGISWVVIDNPGLTHGYTGTESTSCTLSGSFGGYTGSGFVGTLNFRKKPTNVKIKNLGAGFGPMNVTSATYSNDGASAEVYFMGNPTTFVPSTSNLCSMKIILGQRMSVNLPALISSNQPSVSLFGDDEDGFLYGKNGAGVFMFGVNKSSTTVRFANARTSSRSSRDKGVNWSGSFFHKTVKPLFKDLTNMSLMNNKGYPIMESLNEHRSRASIYLTESGFIYQSAVNKILYSGWNVESNGTIIEIYPFLIPAALESGSLKIDDNYNNLLTPIKSDVSITLTGTDVTAFANTNANNQLSVYPNAIQFSDNAVNENSLANTMIVTVTKPKTAIGSGIYPSYTLDDTFWYKGTISNGTTTWADVSAPIRTATRALEVPAGTTETVLLQYAPFTFRWSKDDNLWYAASRGIHYWTSSDLNTWTVLQDPAGLFPQYPD